MADSPIPGGPHDGVMLELVYLTTSNCRLCRYGRQVLDELAERHPITIREKDLLSPEGRRLANTARLPFPPAVFAGERLLAHGRLTLNVLERQLARAQTTTAGEA